MKRISSTCLLLVLLVLSSGVAHAYEAGSTHPGMTGLAALKSGLHPFLRSMGLERGLFAPLTLQPKLMSKQDYRALGRVLVRLPAASGARPDPVSRKGDRLARGQVATNQPLVQWALGWLMAGAVIQGVPAASDLKHFLHGQRGLSQGREWKWSAASLFDGDDSLPSALRGPSALDWIRDPKNPQSLDAWRQHLSRARASKDAEARAHHLARALLALGGILHVLQDMGSPSHVRNDFAPGHLLRLGSSGLDRGSSYERFVSWRYGRVGLPGHRGEVPAFTKVEHFFTAPNGKGLADITRSQHFSPGTLPAQEPADIGDSGKQLARKIQRRMRYPHPEIGAIDLHCARHETCYSKGPQGPRFAYRIVEGKLRFFLDYRCLAASARQLVPLAVGYSTALIDHLLRRERGKGPTIEPGPAATAKKVTAPPSSQSASSRPASRPKTP